MGNVFNADPISGYGFEPHMGWVQIYTAQADLTIVKLDMELKHEVTPRLTKILQVLGHRYSPVHSMVFSLYLDILNFYMLFSQIKIAIFSSMKTLSEYQGSLQDCNG